MDIFISKKMRNFILLAQTNNIARAAEKIHMTASPFGKSIAALEDQIGYTLFTRKDNNISLNKAGQSCIRSCFPFISASLPLITKSITPRRSREIVIGIDNTYPTIIFDQLISLGDKYDGVTARPLNSARMG
jgi:DNA-binding transcriptional LysR family regulator